MTSDSLTLDEDAAVTRDVDDLAVRLSEILVPQAEIEKPQELLPSRNIITFFAKKDKGAAATDYADVDVKLSADAKPSALSL